MSQLLVGAPELLQCAPFVFTVAMSRIIWDNSKGKSYAELSQADSKALHNTSSTSTIQNRPAGTPSNLPLRGAGTFQQSNTWSLKDESMNCLSSVTENRRHFTEKPISASFRDAASKRHERTKDSWPTPSYIPPSESFQTMNQTEFKAITMTMSDRSNPTIRKNSPTSVILKDVEPSFDTAYKTQFKRSSDTQPVPSPDIALRTQKVGYNIINGGPMGDQRWRYESCLSNTDHRRTRGVPIE